MNDGNDSNIDRGEVIKVGSEFKDVFYNTSIPSRLEGFKAPVVLTVNPREMTDKSFFKYSLEKSLYNKGDINRVADNLMFVRVRANMWNLDLVDEVVKHYTKEEYGISVVITIMAYYTEEISEEYKHCYEWKKRNINSYNVLKEEYVNEIKNRYKDNKDVYFCEAKKCKDCGVCLKEYYKTKESMLV
jgi:hypothetical protein